MREEGAHVSARLRRYLDGADLPGDLDLIELDDLEPCPNCGALSASPSFHGHSMHCLRYYRSGDAHA